MSSTINKSSKLGQNSLEKNLLFFTLTFLYILSGIIRQPDPYDEGLIALGAARIISGEMPYRDFWTIYPPGQFLMVSLLFKLLSPSLIVLRIYETLIRTALIFCIWKTIRTRIFGAWKIISFMLPLLWMERFGSYGYPVFTALLFGFLANYYLLKAFEDENKNIIFAVGILCGAIIWFRQDFFVYFLLAISLTSLIVSKNPVKFFIYFPVGILVPVFLLDLFLSKLCNLDQALQMLFFIPISRFAKYRSLPFPSLISSVTNFCYYYLPILILILSGLSLLKVVFSQGREKLDPFILSNFFLLLFLFEQALTRSDIIHMLPLYIPMWLLYGYFGAQIKLDDIYKNRFYGVCVTLPILPFFIAPIKDKLRSLHNLPKRLEATQHSIDRALYIPLSSDATEIIQYLRSNVAINEKIFIGSIQHNKIVSNDIMLYFLADLLPATRFHELHPGISTSAPVQNKIVKELKNNKVSYVVLVKTPVKELAELKKMPEGSKTLDQYLTANFHLVKKFGSYLVYKVNVKNDP